MKNEDENRQKISEDLTSITVRVLIVDDDEGHAQAVADSLERIHCECMVATSGNRGASLIDRENFDVVITDLKMDDIDGLEILQKTKQELPEAEVILLTGHGSIDSAVTAMQHGAYTYLTKPLDINELRQAVEKATSRVRLIRYNAELNRRLDEKFGFEGVIGNSPQMHRVIETLKLIAPTDSTVLILGESGTGKELVARALHHNSPRKNKNFVPINISAIPASILENELFGHEQGAFTGAAKKREGKFEFANGGTLFLDEVGEMPMETQIKLLRVIEDRKISRLGANEEIQVNVRILAATNADLAQMVKEKKFRSDLYHRLNVVSIEIAPIRERKGDIPLLMDHFSSFFSERNGRDVQGFSRAARQAMLAYDWPGNIREIRNMVERMIVLDTDGLLDIDDLPQNIADLVQGDREKSVIGEIHGSDALIGRSLSDVEKYYIQRTLELTEGKREEAASILGIGERTLYRKIKEYEVKN